MLSWNFRHIENGHVRQIENAVKLSTYENQYHLPKRRYSRFQKRMIALCVVSGAAYLLLYIGLFDFVPELFK